MTVVYGTILDTNFLPQGLALYHSWRANIPSGRFYFFAMDVHAARMLRQLALVDAQIIDSMAFLRKELEIQRGFRSNGEMCWASKPLAITYMLEDMQGSDWACYLDGDMALFSDPAPAIQDGGTDAFGLFTPHRFGPSMAHWIPKVGIRNAGFVAFRHSVNTARVLERWFHDCLARPAMQDRNGETFDQKILDHISNDEPGVADLNHPGINLAPWNVDNYTISDADGCVLVDGRRLALYHFQSLRVHAPRLYTLYNGDWRISSRLRRLVYQPYINRLRAAISELHAVDPGYRLLTHPIAIGWKQYLILGARLAQQRRHMALA